MIEKHCVREIAIVELRERIIGSEREREGQRDGMREGIFFPFNILSQYIQTHFAFIYHLM